MCCGEQVMRHPYRTMSLVVASVVLLTGCSMSHKYTLILTVLDAETGEPVEGAIVVIDIQGDEKRKHNHDDSTSIPPTDKEGRLTYELRAAHYDFRNPAWYLKVRKYGYEPVVIDIKPEKEPDSYDVRPLPVTVRMKPIPEKP